MGSKEYETRKEVKSGAQIKEAYEKAKKEYEEYLAKKAIVK